MSFALVSAFYHMASLYCHIVNKIDLAANGKYWSLECTYPERSSHGPRWPRKSLTFIWKKYTQPKFSSFNLQFPFSSAFSFVTGNVFSSLESITSDVVPNRKCVRHRLMCAPHGMTVGPSVSPNAPLQILVQTPSTAAPVHLHHHHPHPHLHHLLHRVMMDASLQQQESLLKTGKKKQGPNCKWETEYKQVKVFWYIRISGKND